jgi:cell division protein FtsN
VGALALVAATVAMLTTGAVSSALDGGPDPAFAARIGRVAAGMSSGMEAHAAAPAAAVLPVRASAPAPGWQVQVGAFRKTPAAEAHLRALEQAVPELARLTPVHQLRGGLNRVRIGGIGDEASGLELCERISSAGSDCFVIGPDS